MYFAVRDTRDQGTWLDFEILQTREGHERWGNIREARGAEGGASRHFLICSTIAVTCHELAPGRSGVMSRAQRRLMWGT
jgi:hypothetical protein